MKYKHIPRRISFDKSPHSDVDLAPAALACDSGIFVLRECQNYRKEAFAIFSDKNTGPLNPSELKTLIEQSLDADKAQDIVSIHLDDQSGLADYMIVASGTSSRHIQALAQKLKDRLNLRGIKNVSIEGMSQCDWVAIDAGDIIVHLFKPEVREFYNIEKMWCAYQPFDVISDQLPA